MNSTQSAIITWIGAVLKVGSPDYKWQEAGSSLAAYLVDAERYSAMRKWFAEQPADIQERELTAVINVVVAVAHADDVFAEEEETLLAKMVLGANLRDMTKATLMASLHERPSLNGIHTRLTHPVLRELILAFAWEVASSDGSVHETESEFCRTLAELLEISQEDSQRIQDGMQEQLH